MLVTVIDGEAVPKVIDFGLAKAVAQEFQLTDMTMQTEFGKVVGTVQYMSPEQAELKGVDAEDVDTRTDVYSLGVMLYELLTGSTPVDKETLGKNALLKVLEIIREEEPPRPSNRLSSSSIEVSSAVSDLRRLHPARLQQLLRGELDWVVMKALEKDPDRRYQTANDLGKDLSNYLTGETVHARPPSTWYQLQKFTSRNRGLVAALLAIGVALLAGIAGTTYGLIRANEKTELAEDKTREAEDERGKAKDSERVALAEKSKAESNKQRAVKAENLAAAEARRARDSEATAKLQLAIARWDAGRARDARDLLREIPSEYRDSFEWNICNRQFEGSGFTCHGHWKEVRGVAFSPDGTRVVTGSGDAGIKLWDANTGQELNTLWGHQGAIDEVVFSPDGTRIASAGSDRILRIWDARSGQTIATLEGHKDDVVGLAFSPNGEQLVSASRDATVKLWDTRSGREISTFEHGEPVADVALSPDGNRLVSCGDSAIVLWNVATGQELVRRDRNARPPSVRYTRSNYATTSIAFSPDGKHIAAASFDTVTLWDAALTQTIWTGIGRGGWIRDLCFSPDGTRIASTGEKDRQIRVWDVRSGSEIMALAGHGETVRGVAFSPDGARLASVGGDKTLRFWDVRTGKKTMSIRAHKNMVSGIAFSNDAARLASVSTDRTFKLWDVTSGLEIIRVNGFDNAGSPGTACVAFSPNDAYVAFGGDDNKVRLLDGQTGAELRSFEGHENRICGVAFDPDSKRLVSGSWDQTVKLWDTDSGEEITTLRGHTGRVNSVAFSPDGTRVVSACEDLTIRFWDTQSGREIMSLGGHQFNVAGIAFSPDGKKIASSSSDHTIRIWDTQSGNEILQMKGHAAGVMGVVFSPDGKRIASTGFDHALKLWDTQTGRELTDIDVDSQTLRAVAFSPDGRRIAVGTDNGIIKFFDAATEHEATWLSGHTDTVIHFSFSDDGRQIYSESKNERLLWDLVTKKRVADATWNPPATHTLVSPDGRWLINGDRNNLILIDIEYKNTPREKTYRDAKARFDPAWHQEQATAATTAKNWYAATFHFALLMKNDPDQVVCYDGLHLSYQELESQFEQQELDLERHLAMVVKESLKLPRGNESTNPSFEQPEVRKGSFEFRETIPGWKTTNKLFEIWSTGFLGIKAFDGNQFVELNAREEGTLYQDSTGIKPGAVIEFSFAHRGRNGDDTLKLTITDLGADDAAGGGDDKELFAREYTTGNSAWAVYDRTEYPGAGE
ncbi:MAG: protein kinase [Fuerstiella sp.]|nr:protein kinase [Fuerstiella sp.]MCP4858455.1 protein kinase [Fuerstiella sp.]